MRIYNQTRITNVTTPKYRCVHYNKSSLLFFPSENLYFGYEEVDFMTPRIDPLSLQREPTLGSLNEQSRSM